MVTWYLLGLAALGVERLVELAISRRNAALALARGGIEVGRGHFRVMALVHAAFLAACAAEVIGLHRRVVPALAIPMVVVALLAQVLRYWAIATLGRRWNVRVIVEPGAPVVARGPYRWVRHPNYTAVVLEGITVPLAGGAWLTAIAFTLANAMLLTVRIACEERALADYCRGAERLRAHPRFVPRWRSAPEG